MYLWDGKNVYFMGFMATGKTHVGSSLANLLGWPFHDTDTLIEEKAGKTITEIFADDGEKHFRDLETAVIADVAKVKHHVIALGGGAVIRPENFDMIKKSGITICLSASEDVIFNRIIQKQHRPLMASYSPDEQRARIKNMLDERKPYYEKADYVFESCDDVSAHQLAEKIFFILRDEI